MTCDTGTVLYQLSDKPTRSWPLCKFVIAQYQRSWVRIPLRPEFFCFQALISLLLKLFAGWEVRIVKNYDRGIENAARGRRPRAAFSSPRSQFFTIRTDLKPANNLFIYFLL